MDTAYIISSEFFIDVMSQYVSIHQLLEFRQISAKLYSVLNMDMIKKLVIQKTQNYIKSVAGDKYEEFIHFIQTHGVNITGIWLSMLIYGEIGIMRIYIDQNLDDMLKYGLVDPTFLDKGYNYNMFQGKIVFVPNYGDNYLKYPEIFQNTIKICDNEWHFEMKNINKVVNRREILNICSSKINNEYWTAKYKEYNIGISVRKVDNYIIKGDSSILGFYDEEHIMILGSCVKIEDKVSIPVIGHCNIPSFDMDICKKCQNDCVLNFLSYEHFHSSLEYRDSNSATYGWATLVKYTTDDDIFVNMKHNIARNCSYIDAQKYDYKKWPLFSFDHTFGDLGW